MATGPGWSPDGRRIAFVSSKGGTEDVWSIAAAGGPTRRVAVGPAERPRWRPAPDVVDLLPDLDQQPPTDLDVRSDHGRHRLWFTAATDNVGIGPLIVSGLRSGITMAALQRVRLSDGGTRAYPQVGFWRYNHSSDHSHWHLLHYQRYELRTQDGQVVVRDRKSGFCLGDRYGIAAGRVVNRVSRPVYTAFCGLHEPNAQTVDGGTSVGFSDRYHSGLDGQNVDITSVPTGDYTLVHKTNTQLLIRELRYTNNAASVADSDHEARRSPAGRARAQGLPGLGALPLAHALPGLAGVRHRYGPRTSEGGATPGYHGSERDRLATDPVAERHPRKLLEDDDRPVADEPIPAVVDRAAGPVERAEHAALGKEVGVLAGHGSLTRMRRVRNLIRPRNAGDEAVPRDELEHELRHTRFRERRRKLRAGGDPCPGPYESGLRCCRHRIRLPSARFRRTTRTTPGRHYERHEKGDGRTST